jgi:hypothetical protein
MRHSHNVYYGKYRLGFRRTRSAGVCPGVTGVLRSRPLWRPERCRATLRRMKFEEAAPLRRDAGIARHLGRRNSSRCVARGRAPIQDRLGAWKARRRGAIRTDRKRVTGNQMAERLRKDVMRTRTAQNRCRFRVPNCKIPAAPADSPQFHRSRCAPHHS